MNHSGLVPDLILGAVLLAIVLACVVEYLADLRKQRKALRQKRYARVPYYTGRWVG